jgi:hypothetical protein
MDFGDLDGDGDLDLVVGGYSLWTPPSRTLTAPEQQRVATIRSDLQALDAELEKLNQVAQAVFSEVRDQEEANKRYAAAFKAQKKEREGPNRKECVVEHLQLGFSRIAEQGRRESVYRNADPDSPTGHNNCRGREKLCHFDSKLREAPIWPHVCRLTVPSSNHDRVLIADQATRRNELVVASGNDERLE